MVDISEQTIRELRERKIKFIEILLIVGGLIGGSWIKAGDSTMSGIFGGFLIGAVLYYSEVSDAQKNSVFDYFSILTATLIVAFCFSSIAILPLKSLDSTAILSAISQNMINAILSLLLTVFIFINLYFPRRYLPGNSLS